MSDRRFGKDFFSWIRLPVAREYIYPPGRQRLFAIGAILAVLVAALFSADAFLGRAGAVTGDQLSDSHALFGTDCSTCHTPFEGAEARKCGSCHERAGTSMALYGWERHYIYRSQDFDRAAAGSLESECAACHVEHQGRNASLQDVSDRRCVTCHELDGGFADGHPEFAFRSEGTPDRANLLFPHVIHVREVMDEEGIGVIEETCFTCHVPTDEGRGFEPISFEASCDACHMNNEATPALPVVEGSGAGVQTLGTIRAMGGPGSTWSHYWDPNEFRSLGPRVVKSPVYHADPWVMENLRRIRRELYPGVTLADLLQTSADLPSPSAPPRTLFEEAITTLRARIEALGGEPSADVQEELDRLNELLNEVETRLDRPFEPLDETRFLVRLADRSGSGEIDESEIEAYESVVEDLTSLCTACHIVDKATILRVQTDQRTMVRSEFDHRAHVLHARCLDCHTEIPIRDLVFEEDEVPSELDRADIQNLPGIDECRSCHTAEGPADQCTTCHVFHPDRSERGGLSRTARRSP